MRDRKVKMLQLLDNLGQLNSKIVSEELDISMKDAAQAIQYLMALDLVRVASTHRHRKPRRYVRS